MTVASRRIAVLAHGFHSGGGLTVGHGMVAALGRVGAEHDYLLVVREGTGFEEASASMPRRRIVVHRPRFGAPGRLAFDRLRLPAIVGDFRPDVVFALHGQGLDRPPCPQAAFPQNAYLFYPLDGIPGLSLPFRIGQALRARALRRSLRATDLVLCQTRVVERRLREALGFRGEAYVCGSAVAPAGGAGSPRELPRAARERFKLLCLSQFYPHKNLGVLLEVFERHASFLGDVVCLTTVAPHQHPSAAGFLDAVRSRGLSDSIVNLGEIPRETVGALARACDAFFLPTLLETFGLPFVEAMEGGLPILASDRDFAREVCGDAAVYVDPQDPDAIARAIRNLVDDEGMRRRLVEAGRARQGRFYASWDAIATETLRRFEGLITRRGA